MAYSLDFPRVYGLPAFSADIRQENKDFLVQEIMPEGYFQNGEHVVAQIEKDGQNTAFVARRLGNFAGVREMDVGYCGLKDRHAITSQWFSIYFGRRPQPDWEKWRLEGTKLLQLGTHTKKLRRGEHECNAFEIVLRNIRANSGDEISQTAIEERLAQIAETGVPNYFGEQRFGRDCHNLNVAKAWFSGEKRMKVKAGAMYISAARAYLFNQVLAERVRRNVWSEKVDGDIVDDQGRVLGPLFGDGQHKETEESLTIMTSIADQWPLLVEGLRSNRIAIAHRPLVLKPEGLQWHLEKDTLSVKFRLPVGAFATSLLREIALYSDVSVRAGSTE